jgi:multiple sugar transport system ATP-binding protein
MAQVILNKLTKYFGRTSALEDLTLTVNEGEFMTILGPSGCGKSTVLNLIAGLEEATSGDIYFDSDRVDHLPPRQRDVAMVFQSYALYPHMKVYDNLAFPLRMSKRPAKEIDERVRKVARLLSIEELLDRRPASLSGGQRQRVALGRATIRRPKIFLLDEPLSNLDARLRVQMRAELKKLHAELGATFIYVTHDQVEAMTLSDRVAILNLGRLKQCGTPQELYNRPENIFVATFLGSPQMNLLEAKLAETDAKASLELPFLKLAITRRLSASIAKSSPSGEVIVGIRPEHISVSKDKKKDALPARLVLVEPVGDFCTVHIKIAGADMVGRAQADFAARAGEQVWLEIASDKMHLFAESTEERIADQVAASS